VFVFEDQSSVHIQSAKLPSVNELVVAATATETWRAYHSTDGGQGRQNPLGQMMFGDNVATNVEARSSRSATAGRVHIPLRGQNTFAAHSAAMWNCSPELRVATTIGEARRVAKLLARKAPV
jgi:hypothetical protein